MGTTAESRSNHTNGTQTSSQAKGQISLLRPATKTVGVFFFESWFLSEKIRKLCPSLENFLTHHFKLKVQGWNWPTTSIFTQKITQIGGYLGRNWDPMSPKTTMCHQGASSNTVMITSLKSKWLNFLNSGNTKLLKTGNSQVTMGFNAKSWSFNNQYTIFRSARSGHAEPALCLACIVVYYVLFSLVRWIWVITTTF